MECNCFKKETRYDFLGKLEEVKDYGEADNAAYGDHVYYSLWRCLKCGVLFLLEEVEHISWSDGNDFFTDNYYQVESPEQADELVEQGNPLYSFRGKKWCV